MATTVSLRPVSIRDYLKFKAPDGYRDELLNGRIIVSPEPKPLHYDIAENIYKLLNSALGKKFKVAQRVNLRFPGVQSMPSPDVFVTSQDSWKRARALNGYPDGSAVVLAVEVLSPGNRKRAVQSKVALYREYGIEVWVIDPKHEEIQIFRDEERISLDLKSQRAKSLPSVLGGKTVLLSRIFSLST